MRGPHPFIDAPDLANDGRFVPFGAAAAKSGCRAVLAHRLYVDGETLGSLNFYGDTVDAFSDADRQYSVLLSVLASLALNAARLTLDGAGLREAVQSRDTIGQAKGILMEREGLSADGAFAHLQQQSQDLNVKLRDLAQQLVEQAGPARRAE
jgi:GAF domain-containing protein